MQGIAVWHLSPAQPGRRTQVGKGLGSGLLVLRLACDNLPQFISEHGANTGSALSGKSAYSLQDLFVDRECDVLLHNQLL
jgi:hypothetical protein